MENTNHSPQPMRIRQRAARLIFVGLRDRGVPLSRVAVRNVSGGRVVSLKLQGEGCRYVDICRPDRERVVAWVRGEAGGLRALGTWAFGDNGAWVDTVARGIAAALDGAE